MQVFPPGPAALALIRARTGDAMSYTFEVSELLYVNMDQLARPLAFVALDGSGRFEVAEAAQAVPAQNSADGGWRDGQITGDLLAGQAHPTLGGDARLCLGRGRSMQGMRSRRAIPQSGQALGFEAGHPLAHRLGAHPHRLGHGRQSQPAADQPHSTRRRLTRILMDVHPVPPTSLKPRNFSVRGSDRMDNLLKTYI